MQNYVNESSERYERFGAMATEAGFRPGSGEWWQALRKFRSENDAEHIARFNELYSKIEHFNRATQLKQVYEWVKTGHISLSEFKGLISRLDA